MSTMGISTDEEILLKAEQNELIVEQHRGKWIYQGDPNDKAAIQKHEEWVASRIHRGIEITAKLRDYVVAGKKAKGKASSKSLTIGALTDDLLA